MAYGLTDFLKLKFLQHQNNVPGCCSCDFTLILRECLQTVVQKHFLIHFCFGKITDIYFLKTLKIQLAELLKVVYLPWPPSQPQTPPSGRYMSLVIAANELFKQKLKFLAFKVFSSFITKQHQSMAQYAIANDLFTYLL